MTNNTRNAALRAVCSLSLLLLHLLQPAAASAQNALDRVGLTSATPASPAYSLRKLSDAYAGKAVQVRRSSNNNTLDIGFTSNGDLDTAALKAFAGSGDAYVSIWYDQSGYAINAVQASSGLQPRLVNAGVIERLNGRPALWLGTMRLATAAQTIFTTAASMVGVAKGTGGTPSAFVTKTGTSAGVNQAHPGPFDYTNTGAEFTVGNAATAQYSFIQTGTTTPASGVRSGVAASVYSFVIPGTSGTYYNYVNGVQAGSNTVTAFQDGGNPLVIGNRNDGSSSGNLWTPELILFNSALGTSTRNLLETAQRSYYFSDDASLSGIGISGGNNYLLPVFSKGTLAYKSAATADVSFSVTTTSSVATVQYRFRGGAWTDIALSTNSATLSLAANADNALEIRVTAQSGAQRTYTVNLRKVNTLDRAGLWSGAIGAPAYSLRLICSDYNGKAVNVRRGSDNATQDIGFTATGDFDTAALKTFVGSGDGYVITWYDQGGLNIPVTQSDPALQPKIMTAGKVERTGGRPALYFGNSNLATSKQILFPYAVSMVGVVRANGPIPSTVASKTGTATDSVLNFPAPFDFVNTGNRMMVGDPYTGALGQTQDNGGVTADAFAGVFSFYETRNGNGANYFYSYKNDILTGSAAQPGYRDGGNALRLGNRNDGGGSGHFWTPELVFFNDNANDYRWAIQDAQKAYYSIPCPALLITAQPQSKLACPGATVSFSVTASGSGLLYQWYRSGTPVGANSATLTLSNISISDTGRYTCTVYNACDRSEISAVATLRFPTDSTLVPVPLVAGSRTFCSGGATTLTATGGTDATYRWYTVASGGAPVFTGATYATPTLTETIHYYVATVMCGFESARLDVLLYVIPYATLAAPVSVAATPASICQQQASGLTAVVDSAAAQEVHWYDAATGGNLLGSSATGQPFYVSPLATTTYYAQSEVKTHVLNYTTPSSSYTFTVPDGVTSLDIDAKGGTGGRLGGNGGRVQSTLQVTPGQVLYITVGQAGWAPPQPSRGGPSTGGGGASGWLAGGVGGGATDIRIGGTTLTDRILVAGGGGGGFDIRWFNPYSGSYSFGGAGGGLNAGSSGGGGGTQTAGGGVQTINGQQGAAPGGFGYGGDAYTWGGGTGGGGGGGWYGGGGGASAGGGGGSSYTDPSYCANVTHTQGFAGASADGYLKITYSEQASCGASTTRVPVTVTVRTRPDVTAPADFLSCADHPITLTATGADTYQWTPGNASGADLSVAPAATTTYTVVGSLANGCADTAQTVVTINALVATGATICAGTSATLNASGAETYSWSPGGLTGNSIQVSPTVTTTYTVTGSNASGCQSTATAAVVVNPLPALNAGPDVTVAPGTVVTLTATTDAGTIGWWAPIRQGGASINALPAQTTTYLAYSTFDATGCMSLDQVTVTVAEAPAITGSTTICSGASTTLTATGTAPITWYNAETGGTLLQTGASFTTPALGASTTYWVSAADGPRMPVKVFVQVIEPVATPAAICAGESSVLSATNLSANLSWYAAASGGSPLASGNTGYSVQPAQTTTYYVEGAVESKTDTFYYTGGAQTFTVPDDVTSIQVDLRGAAAGGPVRGTGGRVQATLNVTPGQVLYLYAGGQGNYVPYSGGVVGGYNGGGRSKNAYSGSGGGATDIRIGGTALTDRVMVAGGGAGGVYTYAPGGNGGGLTGGNSPYYNDDYSPGYTNGKPGTQTAPGDGGNGTYPVTSEPGGWGYGGDGYGGAGGGGWFGGGSGSSIGAGSGGSSYTNPSLTQNVVHTQGYQDGSGLIILNYRAACTIAARVPITVPVTPVTALSISASADTTCTSVELTASGAASYLWSVPARISATSYALAAGLHALVPHYQGPAVRLRRAMDNAQQDFGFVNGDLDLSAIRAFVGLGACYVVTLYDQSGRGNHLEQSIPQRQPLFVASGINGKPAIRVGASPGTYLTSPVVLNAPYTALYLARQNGPARGRMLSSVYNNWLLGWHGGKKKMAYFDGVVNMTGAPADNGIYLYAATRSGSTTRVFENGSQLYNTGAGSGGIYGLQVNGYSNDTYELSDGDFGDIILFGTVLSDADRAEAEAVTSRYYGLATAISNETITVFPGAPSTTYYVTGTAVNGCTVKGSKTIVKDGKPPVIQCPADQQLILNTSCSATLPDYRALLTVIDNCTPAAGLVITQTPAAGTAISGMDTVQVQFTVRDSSNYSATCSIRVIPSDTATLRLTCPSGQTLTQSVSACGALATLTAPVATYCRPTTIAQSSGLASGSIFPVGVSPVTYTISDAAGNSASCSYNITVIPLSYAVAVRDTVCDGGTTQLTLSNTSGGTVSWYTEPAGGGTLAATGNPATLGAGTYYALYAAPCGVVEVPVSVYNFSSFPFSITGDSTICPGTRSFVEAVGTGTVQWQQPLPVDVVPASARLAAGLRLLKTGYAGSLVLLRRSSDGAQQAFGAVDGALDTASIRTWLNGASAFCVTLYDQSGSGNNITQANVSAQPLLLLASAVNGRPALRFNTAQYMQLNTAFPAPFTLTVAARQTGGSRGRVLSSVSNNWLLGWHAGYQSRAYFEGWVNQANTSANNDIQLYTGTSTGTASELFENGMKIASNGNGTAGVNGLQLNGFQGGNELSDCEILEVLAFNTVLSNADQTMVEAGTYSYFINPKKLLVAATSVPKTYTVTVSSAVCGFTRSASVTVRSAAAGDPSLFGQNAWNVYAWQSGSSGISAMDWNEGYSGYFSTSDLGLNTAAQWSGSAPSSAAGYSGCAVAAQKHAWIAKRKGFPCAYYRIDINSHEAGQLFVNGVKVWEHDGCCDSHPGAWTGSLGAADSVEYRTTRNGTSLGTIVTLNALTPALSYPENVICGTTTNQTPSVNLPGGTYSATPAGLLIDATTGVVTGGATGTYQVTYTLPAGCSATTAVTTSMTLTAPAGDPAVYGSNAWNVYVWNSGGNFTGNSWNANYSGYYTATGVSFNSANQWANNTAPSSAPGYQGCQVGATNNSWAAKREGFPCGRYRIDIPYHVYSAQLWINGTRVWFHNSCCDAHTGVWTGLLGPADKVEFRVTQGGGTFFGSGGQINIVALPFTSDLAYPAAAACTSMSSFVPTFNQPGGTFSSTPAGLSLDTATGIVDPSASSPGNYSIVYAWTSACGDLVHDTAQLALSASSGDPSVFGSDEWRVYVWNSGGAVLNPNAWNTNYSGFYTATGVDFGTQNQWGDGAPPSDAPGYAGCPVGASENSWSAKRRGFPCGFYSINIDSHDDAAQLWINGVLVWEHNSCCDAHGNVWEGTLGATDSVEFRVTQGSGGSHGTISFHLASPTISYGGGSYCSSVGLVSLTTAVTGGTFSASPAGLVIDPASGQVDAGASAGGSYTVLYTVLSPCGDTLHSTAPITIEIPAGDPAVPGAGIWNLYFWNDGEDGDPTHSWNTAYAGFLTSSSSLFPAFTFTTFIPSDAVSYEGCPISSKSYSYIAKRKGFPCGRYQVSLPTFEGTGELWINGALVRTIGMYGFGSSILWQGYLSTDDVVEVRVRSIAGYGSRVRINIVSIGDGTSLSYPAQQYCVSGAAALLTPTIPGVASGTFTASPAGLSINAATGVVDPAASQLGSYTINFNGTSLCGNAVSASTTLAVQQSAGDPSVYGQDQWNVYAWNAGMTSGTPWSSNYAGYYTETTLGFNTQDRWNASPSEASGYQGCTVGNDEHSWSAKRKGFPCGYYQINIPAHDDDAELWINGVRVFNHVGCCDSHNNVWSGGLGPQDSVEYRVLQGVGGTNGAIEFVLQSAITFSSWTGAADNDWNNAANWCGPVPTATTDVVIPVVARMPIVYSGGAADTRNLTVQGGTSLTVQGTLNLYGNLVNNGGALDLSAGRLDLEGSTRQQVPAFAVAELHVNGGGGFTLSGTSAVSGALSFGASGGTVLLGSSDLTVGSINGGDVHAFVVTGGSGLLKRKALNGTQLMPVGVNASSYTPLTITSSDGIDWSVRLQAGFAGYPAINQSLALQRIWHITPSQSPTITPADLLFTYPDSLWGTPALVSVFHYGAAGTWTPANNNATGLVASLSGGLRSVALVGQQQFSPFALSGTSTPLPVTLLTFTGRQAGGRNLLSWRTASEQGNRGFSVERSYDGTRFVAIGFVESLATGGNSSSALSYGFADSSFAGARQFYRLRQEDIDGHSRYSHILLLGSEAAGAGLQIYPIPASTKVFVRLTAAAEGRYHFQLTDMRGRIVHVQQQQVIRGGNTIIVPLNRLAAGSYLLEVLDEAGNRIGAQLLVKE
ncbi:MAG: HYR domain-containing protein [Chitinophagaceae bacterium]|nr:MAG: HYR domain-containing protein [Chitinophagaceae bacterium]